MPIAARYIDGFSPFGKKGRMRKFASAPENDVFIHHPHADGTSDLRPVRNKNGISRLERGEILARVDRRVFETSLVFPGQESEDAEAFDLSLSVVWRIANPRNFLREYAMPLLKSQDEINPVSLENLLISKCKRGVADEMRTVTYEYLKNRDALPEEWWVSQLPEWLGYGWLDLVEVKAINYDSPTADRQMELKAHERLMEIEREAEARRKAGEIEEEQQKAALEDGLREIEFSKGLSEMDRQNRAELIRLEHDQAVLRMKEKTGLRKLKAEKERARLEAEIATIRNHDEEADERLRKAEASEEEARNMLAAVGKAQSEIAGTMEMMKAAAKQEVANGKRLSEHTVNISPETLALVGRAESVQYLTAIARTKANASPGTVTLKKVDLRSRDIGTRRVKSLAIGSSLEFELASRRAGHVTVLNIGTSGAVYLLAPNGIVNPKKSLVPADQEIGFPGAPLLPDMPLYENGPPGWEEMIVFVSEKPLITYSDLVGADEEAPEVKLNAEQVSGLVEQLSDMPEDTWNAGLLGFMVEG